MKIVCIGDSLTEGDYGVFGQSGIANVKKESYPYFLAKELQSEVVNAGKCGYTASSYLAHYRAGNVKIGGADIVLLMLGTNGGLHPENDTQGNRDYETLVSCIRLDAPQAELILITPPHVTENPDYSNCGYAPQVRDAAGFVRGFAKAKGLRLIDAAEFSEFTAENEHILQPNDGLHFGQLGYETLAKNIAKQLLPVIAEKRSKRMKILCVGDSLTEGEFGVPGAPIEHNIQPINYPYYLAQYLDCETVNAGKCGYTSCQYLEYYEQGNVPTEGVDIILLMLGSNGGQNPDEDNEYNRDYEKLVALLQRDMPNAKLVLITPPHASADPKYFFHYAAPMIGNAAAFVRKFAKEHDLLLIDAAQFEEFCAETESLMQYNDGLHYVRLGYQTMAIKFAVALKKMHLA